MKPTTNERRLGKYQRKLTASFARGHGYDRLSILKWRYHRKIHGPHVKIWSDKVG